MRILPIIIIAAFTAAAHAQYRPLSKRDYPIDTTLTLDQLIAELRDDDYRKNATLAMQAILSYPTSPLDKLYETLDHPEWQTRQIACYLIWRVRDTQEFLGSSDKETIDSIKRYSKHLRELQSWRLTETPPITERLVEVTIEGLRDDQTPHEHAERRALMYRNAEWGLRVLTPHASGWIPQLREALTSDDHQQRLIAAMIVARSNTTELIEPACAILLPHLRDNDIRQDAIYALWALSQFDSNIIPILQRQLPRADQQQRELIQLLILNQMDPHATPAEREARGRRYNHITTVVHDPVATPKLDTWSWLDQLKDKPAKQHHPAIELEHLPHR